MAKFVRPALLLLLFNLIGCASMPMAEYISRVDHPYDRKFYASFEKVISTFIYVLRNQGWAVSESDPSIYERDERYDNNGYRNLLIITDTRKKPYQLTRTHLNVFIHAIGNTCDVEIRYEARTSLIKQFISTRNDSLVQGIWDAVSREINK